MSYYTENAAQWAATGQNAWEHQSPARSAGATGPTPQDDYAFSSQFDEVDRAYENLSKSGKAYNVGGRHGRLSQGGSRQHSMNEFSEARGPQSNLQNFYATQRHQSSRGSNEAEQMMQAKRRMAAQRERELRNLHTEQQFQRTAITDISYGKSMSEEETRDLIARQRSALYGEGSFAEKGGYVDETGAVRAGGPPPNGPGSRRGHSPLAYDMGRGSGPTNADANTPVSTTDGGPGVGLPNEQGSRSNSSGSPSNLTANKNAFDGAVAQAASRTANSSPGGSPPRQDLPAGPKPSQPSATVAPIGTRPSGTTPGGGNTKRSTTPLASPGGWGRGNGVWGQSSGLGAPASVWG